MSDWGLSARFLLSAAVVQNSSLTQMAMLSTATSPDDVTLVTFSGDAYHARFRIFLLRKGYGRKSSNVIEPIANRGSKMNSKHYIRSGARWVGAGTVLAAAVYATSVGATWYRYGHAERSTDAEDRDPDLDQFIPFFDVAERHRVLVAAPAEITFSAACDMSLQQSAVIRAIFRSRELILGGKPDKVIPQLGLIAQAKALGWAVLAEHPGCCVIFGAVTQPWLANPIFRALAPSEFATFHEPGYVKIAWTLRVDSVDATKSVARTETRVLTTDVVARTKFRRYWAFVLPGIVLIRRIALRLVKAEAERRAKKEKLT